VPGPTVEILLVEDSAADAGLIQEFLSEGAPLIRFHWVRDGEEALCFVRREGRFSGCPRPDLILLDLNLPKRDGREVLAEIRATPELRSLIVVILTTSKSPEDIRFAYEHNANSYLIKPTDVFELEALLKSVAEFWFQRSAMAPHG
jgi:two-component system, chemotaxis family, response regulator Rcp1